MNENALPVRSQKKSRQQIYFKRFEPDLSWLKLQGPKGVGPGPDQGSEVMYVHLDPKFTPLIKPNLNIPGPGMELCAVWV